MGQSREIDDDKNLQKAHTQISEPRVHCPKERSKAEEVENYQYTSALMEERLNLFLAQLFLLISWVFCDEYRICQARTGRLVLAGQSHSLFVPTSLLMKTPTLSTDVPAQEDLVQMYKERVERLSQQNRVIKICTDAGFLTTWQRTLKNSHNSQNQWHVVSTLCQEMKNHLRKVGFEGIPKLVPYWKFQPVACTASTELRSELCLWTKTMLTRGSEFLMTWISWSRTWATQRTTTTSRKPLRWSRKNLRWNECTCFCKPTKGQSKTTKTYSCLLVNKNCTYLRKILDWFWARNFIAYRRFSVKTTGYSSSSWSSTSRRRRSGWILENKRFSSEPFCVFSTLVWWKVEEHHGKRGGHKKRFQYCFDSSGTILFLRARQGHSGRSLIDPTLQDNVMIPDGFFKYVCPVRCAINLHSIMNSGLILGGQKFEQKTDGILYGCESHGQRTWRSWHDRLGSTASCMVQAEKVEDTKKIRCYWVDIKLAQQKGFTFYQKRSNAIILFDTLPAYRITKAIMMETGKIIYEKVYACPQLPPKISFRNDWMKELGSEVVRQAEDNQPTQPKSSYANLSIAVHFSSV